MKEQILMIYQIPQGNAIKRITFNRKLFAYNIQSHKGKYKNKTNGILEEYEKPTRSCVIFTSEHTPKVKELCKELAIPIKLYKITSTT